VIAPNAAERMKASLGQSVIIEDVIGAGGSIPTGQVVRDAYESSSDPQSRASREVQRLWLPALLRRRRLARWRYRRKNAGVELSPKVMPAVPTMDAVVEGLCRVHWSARLDRGCVTIELLDHIDIGIGAKFRPVIVRVPGNPDPNGGPWYVALSSGGSQRSAAKTPSDWMAARGARKSPPVSVTAASAVTPNVACMRGYARNSYSYEDFPAFTCCSHQPGPSALDAQAAAAHMDTNSACILT